MEFIPIKRRGIDLKKYIEQSVLPPLLSQAQNLDVGLELSLLSPLPQSVAIDPEKIGWVVSALVGNALRFVKHGSRNLPGGFIHVELAYDKPSQKLTINVKDDGPGIPAERLPLLFKVTSDDQPVFGLALKVAHDILVAHGGKIRAESNPQGPVQGTSFYMELPAPAGS
jgi:signal transduction histidine kinase